MSTPAPTVEQLAAQLAALEDPFQRLHARIALLEGRPAGGDTIALPAPAGPVGPPNTAELIPATLPVAGAEGEATAGATGTPRKRILAIKGNGVLEKFICIHNLGTKGVVVQVYTNVGGGPGELTAVSKVATSGSNAVEITLAAPLGAGTILWVTVIG